MWIHVFQPKQTTEVLVLLRQAETKRHENENARIEGQRIIIIIIMWKSHNAAWQTRDWGRQRYKHVLPRRETDEMSSSLWGFSEWQIYLDKSRRRQLGRDSTRCHVCKFDSNGSLFIPNTVVLEKMSGTAGGDKSFSEKNRRRRTDNGIAQNQLKRKPLQTSAREWQMKER